MVTYNSNLRPIKTSFTAGEIAPSLWGRPDLAKYSTGVRRLENFRVQPYGGIAKRNGTKKAYYFDPALVSQHYGITDPSKTKFIPFNFSLDDTYMLFLYDNHVMFFRGGEVVTNTDGTPFILESPYTSADIAELSYTQSADVLFLVCPNKPPYELYRVSSTEWHFTEFAFEDGPFAARTVSDEEISIATSGTTGDIRVLADANLFVPEHVGSLWNTVHTVDAVSVSTTGATARASTSFNVITLYNPRGIIYTGDSTRIILENWFFAVTAETFNQNRAFLVSGQAFVYNGTTYTITTAPSATIVGEILYRPYTGSVGDSYSRYSIGSIALFKASPNHLYTNSTFDWGYPYNPIRWQSSGTATMYTVSDTINVGWGINMWAYDTWNLQILGFWYGSVALERYDTSEQRWVTIEVFSSPQTTTATAVKNFDVSGSLSSPAELRVRAISGFIQFKPTSSNVDADMGYVRLSRASSASRGTFRVTEYLSSTEVDATVISTLAGTSNTLNWQQGAWSEYEGYPTAVGFFEERLSFASTRTEPQTLWMSKSGDYYNFGSSLPVVDDDAITRTLASRQLNKIEAIIPLNALILTTSANEWKITGGSAGGLTPTNFTARLQGNRGSSHIEPILVNATVLFAQAKGHKVNDLMYSYETDLYQGSDLTTLSNHIFQNYPVKGWAFQAEPDSTVWMIRSDGMLVSLTYLRDHDVIAWARHPMPGATCHTIGCVDSRDKDTVYLLAERNNGSLIIETLNLVHETEPEECYYVDSGVVVESDSADISVVTGLGHLEGMTVSVLVDGNVPEVDKTVINGEVTLSYLAQKAVVGAPYEAYVETLDLGFDRRDGSQLTAKARIPEMKIRVENTRGLFISTTGELEYETEVKDRTTEGQGSPIALFTGDIDISSYCTWDSGRIHLRSPHPLPARILAIVPSVDIGGR